MAESAFFDGFLPQPLTPKVFEWLKKYDKTALL
jgi:hypothetical protein